MLSSSPKLFAANHVLHRLLPPRHSPFALCSLTNESLAAASHLRPPKRPRPARCATHAFRHRVQTLWTQKDIRLSKTAGISHPTTGLSRAGRPRGTSSKSRNRGGADRDRTDDLRLAKPALSQLSYSPRSRGTTPSITGRAPISQISGPAWRSRLARCSWWAWVDLNHRPPAYQADALTN